MPGSSQRLTHNDYTVGWICALPKTELVAAEAMLDEEHPVLPAAQPEDENTYSLGRIGDHNVVIACLPAEQTGKASAATVAKDMLRSFPAVRFGLMVGIGGGAPYYGSQSDDEVYSDSEEESDDDIRDIRLGDAVISLHTKETEAVVQYDFGKSLQENKFVRSGGQLNKPPRVVLNAVARLQGQHVRKGSTIPELLKEALDKYPLIADSFRYPLRAKDRLFKPDAVHQEGRKSCKACCGPDNINLVSRPDRATTAPSIHYGTIGSADQVMKDAVLRDQWAEKENIICFEMEAAGLMDSYPCLVIRGICDYADSHKNKTWQPYAAATAASCAKELLLLMPGQDVAGLTPIKQMSNQLARIEESTREVKHTIFYSQEEKQRKEILSSLSTLDYNTRHIDIFSRRTEGTGTWFVNTSSFITWRDTPGQTLYCPGIPGAGKTVLTSVIIDHIRPTLHDNNAALAFIYCAYNDRMKAEDLIRSLLKQIASQVPFVPNEVKNLADIYKSPNKPTPRANDVIQTLRSLTSRFARVYVVIDALDECSDDDRTDLLDALNKLRPLMNILVTSRPVASIKVSLRADLEQCIAAANDDIISYVEAQITGKRLKLSDELFKKPELRSQIVSELVASAKGMFLHARFHMEQLAPKHNILDLRNALKNLPKTSEEVYEKAMERVQSQDNETVSLANRTLQCVIGAVRFLHIHELQHALAVREGDYDIDEEALTAPNHLLSICAGLLTLNEEDGVIRLVHYTAQEFFKKHEHKYFSDAQEELTSICLTYLSLGVFDIDYQDYIRGDPDLWAERYALFEYAATNMGEHASGGIKGVMLQEAVKLFLNENKVTIAADTALTEYQHLGLFDLPDGFTGIHYASYLGLPDVIGQLFEQDWESIDRGDSYGRSSLSWAAERGHKAAVKLLLDTDKVNVDSQDRDCQTPLSYAAKYGHEAVVKLLLDTDKVDVDSQDRDRQTPLSYAAENGHEAVLKLLLDTGKVDVDSQDRDRQTPLSYAAVNGHEAVVKLLLDTGRLDVELQNVYGKTPLSWAAERGHEAVLKLLLDTDKVKFDSKDEFGRTPLSDAARQGHEAVVMLLLGTGKVDLDSKDESGRTPLSWAAEEGHEAVVKLLLEAGRVDLDSKDESGRTPLSWAAEEGHEAVVKLLLETGRVDIMLKDEDDWTPLEWAEENGHKEVVELLCHDGKMDVD